MRALQSVVRRVLACRPVTDDPAECGLGRGPAVTEAFLACRDMFWSGVEDVRTDSDERTLPEIERAVNEFMRSEGAARVRLGDGFADLLDARGGALAALGYADLRMPACPDDGGGGGSGGALDRTLGPGWRRRLWTTALLHRALLWRRRGLDARLRDRKTALTIAALGDRVPPDVVFAVVGMVRRG